MFCYVAAEVTAQRQPVLMGSVLGWRCAIMYDNTIAVSALHVLACLVLRRAADYDPDFVRKGTEAGITVSGHKSVAANCFESCGTDYERCWLTCAMAPNLGVCDPISACLI